MRESLEPGSEILLGRTSEVFGAEALKDDGVSREHAVVSVNELSEASVSDRGSRNGTYVNGKRVSVARLRDGDVVSVGSVMLLLHRLDGTQTPFERVERLGQRAVASSNPVLLVGDTGTGKDRLARWLHQERSPKAPFVTVRCAALGVDSARAALLGTAEQEPGLLASAGAGTLYLDGIEHASEPLQLALVDVLESRTFHPVGASTPAALNARVIGSSRLSVAALTGRGLSPAFVHRLTQHVVRLPSLAEQRERILPLARELASNFDPDPRPFHRKLALRLLQHTYSGNVRELGNLVESIVVDHQGDGPYRLTQELAERLVAGDILNTDVSRLSMKGRSVRIALNGEWAVIDGERIDLARRKALKNILAALARARLGSPGRLLSLEDLLAAGWPGEKVMKSAGRNRVFVALTTLRKLGLRDVMIRRDDGYLLDPDLRIELEAE